MIWVRIILAAYAAGLVLLAAWAAPAQTPREVRMLDLMTPELWEEIGRRLGAQERAVKSTAAASPWPGPGR